MSFVALLVLGILAGIFLASFIGANDSANSVGAALGCGLSIYKVIFMVTVFEIIGAIFLGGFVSQTISRKILVLPTHGGEQERTLELMLVMLSVLIGSGMWLTISTIFSLPVSTTHSVIGSVVGCGVLMGGLDVIEWRELMWISIWWVASPIVGAFVSLIFWFVLKRLVVASQNSVSRMLTALPFLSFVTIGILLLFVIYQGLSPFNLSVNIYIAIPVSLVLAIFCGCFVWKMIIPEIVKQMTKEASRSYRDIYLGRVSSPASSTTGTMAVGAAAAADATTTRTSMEDGSNDNGDRSPNDEDDDEEYVYGDNDDDDDIDYNGDGHVRRSKMRVNERLQKEYEMQNMSGVRANMKKQQDDNDKQRTKLQQQTASAVEKRIESASSTSSSNENDNDDGSSVVVVQVNENNLTMSGESQAVIASEIQEDNDDENDNNMRQNLKSKGEEIEESIVNVVAPDNTTDDDENHDSDTETAERHVFRFLVILTSGCIAMAHGANDLANASAPLSVIAYSFRTRKLPDVHTKTVLWVTLLTTFFLILGFVTLGYRVMKTIGTRITKLTPARAFVAQLSAAAITLTCSLVGIPLSTTHITVGCIYGISIIDMRSISDVKWKLIIGIVMSWVVTIPFSALLSVAVFAFGRAILI